MLLREIKNIFHKELDALYPKEEVDSFFYMLIEHYYELPRFILAMQPEYVLSKEEEQPMFEAIAKLHLHTPIQHIIGSAYFMEMDFKVNENVLIPRSETEELVQWILDEVNSENNHLNKLKELKILDIGTGTGCIAIALAKNLSNAKVSAVDTSLEALQIAKQNALANGVEIEFLQQDIFEINLISKFNIIASNPPYVRLLEKKEMHKNVLDKEPDLALYVSDENPLIFYKKITELAKDSLHNDGYLFFEVNQYLGEETRELLVNHNFSEIELRKDLFGNNRMLKAMQR